VHVDGAEIHWGQPNSRTPYVQLTVVNTGATPAKWFEYQSRAYVGIVTGGGEIDPWDIDNVPVRWANLGGGGELSVAIRSPLIVEGILAANEARGGFRISGVLRYETFFGELFESEFSFFTPVVPSGDFSRESQNTSAWAGHGRVVERPRKLSRTTHNLRSYEHIKAKP
jgi:hypothetical protein